MMKRLLLIILILHGLTFPLYAAVEDYLIVGDIGSYKISKPHIFIPGEPPTGGPRVIDWPGILTGTDHVRDHVDKTYKVMYIGGNGLPSPEVQVTQHTNSDSDMWLLHETDRDFRNYFGIPGRSYGPRVINGQTILEDLVGGGHYRWLSGNKVISIEYRDSQMTKPEPIEIIQAYLAKHPSTIQPFTIVQLRSTESKTKWIKDEMDRRLWICGKWFYQLQLGKVELKDVIWNAVRSMTVFINYREKYYGISAKDDKLALQNYQMKSDGTSIKMKLQEYKNWWIQNKNSAISL